MSTISRKIITIPVDSLEDTDRMFCNMTNLDPANIPAKFKDAYEKTREAAYRNFIARSIFESFEIDQIKSNRIFLTNGICLESDVMADVFKHAFELVFIVTTIYGYDELDDAEDNMSHKFFLDNWGTAFIESANSRAEHLIAHELEHSNLYCTHSFSPGQNDIPMEMQADLFRALKPEELGVTLNAKHMMHPKKSVSGIFGIQSVRDENGIRPCDLCDRRDTCPTSYLRLNL